MLSAVIVLLLAALSISIGVYSGGDAGLDTMVLLVSRIPRTLAILLLGASTGIAGMIMQILSRNRFVSPTTAGTTESATFGILMVTLLAPGAPVAVKILFATVAALIGTGLFLLILSRIPLRSPLVVPLVGIMLGGVISSVTTFIAYRYELLQAITAWTSGDFSRILRGRYEMLWISSGLALLAYLFADQLTVAGLGEAFTRNLGINYRLIMTIGLTIVCCVVAVNVVTVGAVPFLGLVVPNIVSILLGDNIRRTAPWVAIVGAIFLLACDTLGRVLRYPFEIPIMTTAGVAGSALFLFMLLKGAERVD